MDRNKTKIFVVIILILSLFYIFAEFRYGLNIYDEGILLHSAEKVTNGCMPYRDFFVVYGPGLYYLLGFLFEIFGKYVIVERIYSKFIEVCIIICCSLLVRKLTSAKFALLTWFIIALLFKISVSSVILFNSQTFLFIFLNWFALINFFSSKKTLWLLLAGILTGIAGIFRYDFAAYILLAQFFIILIFNKSFKKSLIYLLPVMVIIIPVYLLIVSKIPSDILKFDYLNFLFLQSHKFYTFSYPEFSLSAQKLKNLLFYLPFLIFGLGIFKIFIQIKNKEKLLPSDWLILILILSGIVFFMYVKSRPDIAHLFPVFIPAVIILFYLYKNYFFKAGIYIILFLGILSFSTALLDSFIYVIPPIKSWFIPLELKRGKGMFIHAKIEGNMQSTLKFIQKEVPETEKIFVAKYRHDNENNLINDNIFYFLSERDSPTRYFNLAAGLVTTEFVQKTIVKDLINNNVKYIVVWNGNKRIPLKSSKVFILDDFINKNYTNLIDFGEYSILKINSGKKYLYNNPI